MSDAQTSAPGATLKLSPETIQSIRDAWRGAGGVDYSSPKGQICAMSEPKLLAFLSEILDVADSTAIHRAGPAQDLAQHCAEVETALLDLVKAICPGIEHHDLLADAAIARAAMVSAEPAGHFAIDDEPGSDGSARYLHIGAQHSADPDVFPLYRRAPTVAELAAHVAQHQVAAPVAGQSDTKVTVSAKKAGTK